MEYGSMCMLKIEELHLINPTDGRLPVYPNHIAIPLQGVPAGRVVGGGPLQSVIPGYHAFAHLIATEGIVLGKSCHH